MGLEESPGYVVGVQDAETGQGVFPFADTSAGHRLPGWILALVTGWRCGGAVKLMSVNELDTAIALLSPAAATMFEHPDLDAWKSISESTGPNARFVVRFSPAP